MSGHRHHMKLPEAGCVASALLNSPIAIRPAQKQLAMVGVESTHLIHISSEKPSSSAVTETETEVLISACSSIWSHSSLETRVILWTCLHLSKNESSVIRLMGSIY